MVNEVQVIGTNVSMEVKGNIMTLTIDLSEEHGMSSSGKTKVVATTSGSKNIATPVGNVLIGVNINRK